MRARRRGALVAAGGAGAVAIALVAVLATRPPATASQVDSPLLGKPAPAISGPGVNGGTVSLSAAGGRFVLVDFFASWCGPCHQEAPELSALSRHLSLLGVTYDDARASAAAFLASTGAHWPAVVDSSGAIAIAYGVRGPPEAYLVSPDGTVVAKVIGPIRAAQVAYLDGVMARTLRTGQ